MDCSCCLVAEWCPTLCDPVDCSPPGSSVPGISQARILQWVAISFSSRYSWPREQTCISCTGRWILSHWATKEAHDKWIVCLKKRLQCPLDIGDWDGEVEIYQNDLYMLLLAFYCLLLFIYVFIYFCFFFKWLIWWGMRRAWQPTPIFLHREFPWTEVPGGIQSMGSQRVGNHWTSNHSTAHGEG